MFNLTEKQLIKIESSINRLQNQITSSCKNFSYSDCPCQGQCGNTGSSSHYHCPSAANDNGNDD